MGKPPIWSLPWRKASAPIWARVAGFAPSVRRTRRMMFLQAATDDSSSNIRDRRLVMAGYLHTVEEWAKFSVAWDKALKAKPSIKYLKMAEARGLRGQFRGWDDTERDKKLLRLAKTIQKFLPFSYQVSVGRTTFEKLFRPDAPYGLGKPHFACVFAIVASVTGYIAERGVDAKTEFIFDRQDEVSGDIRMFFDYMCENLSDQQRTLIRETPSFEDDRDFLPLQAADMLAWHVRREHEENRAVPLPMASLLRNPHAHLILAIEADALARMAKAFRQFPGLPLTQGKGQWKDAKQEISRLLATGFKPSHGNWADMHKATLEHLARVANASKERPS